MNLNLIRQITQKMGVYYFLGDLYQNSFVKPKYKKIEKLNRIKLDEIKSTSIQHLNYEVAKAIANVLPNSGGIPVDVKQINLDELKNDIIKNESRKTGIGNFDGLALNDAIATEDWKHFSFFDLAVTISEIAKQTSGKNKFSILEMGSGAGSMFDYFRCLGAELYIGIDGNPLAFAHSSFIRNNKDFFRLLNLQEEINFNTSFDLVYSSEVLEHIREDKTDFFIKTIANHMGENSLFMGTIARTVMDVHINLHDKKWWLNKFEKHGLKPFEFSNEFESKLANSHPYNWDASTSHLFALKKS